MRGIVGLLVLVSLAGCAASGAQKVDSDAGFESTCPRGLTRPFTVDALIRIGRAHGISLGRDPDCTVYTGEIDAATNVVDATSDEYDEITEREGHVSCSIGDEPRAEKTPEVRRTKYPEDDETYLDVGNVRCAIYPERPEQVEQLRAALAALGRGPREQRDCPTGRPAPIGVVELARASRRRGIRLQRDERCIAPGVLEQASNVLVYLPYGAGDREWDRIEAEEGLVTCLLRGPEAASTAEVEETEATVTTRLVLRNVECWVTTQDERHVDALRAVFRDLGGR